MTEDSEKDTCQKLYKQYTNLVKDMQSHMQVTGRRADPKYIKPEDFAHRKELRLQLLNCKDSLKLSAREWFKIENSPTAR